MIYIPKKPDKIDGKIKVGLDMDGTITDHPAFFSALSYSDKFEIHIITGRSLDEHKDQTIEELKQYDIKYHAIHFVDAVWEKKGEVCKKLGIQIMFDDMDEFIKHISESTMVFKVRNGGNWNEKTKQWL